MVLPGVVRKVSTAFLLLSLAGWITFGVGFGFRNFEYSKQDDLPRATLYPEFTCLWIFGISFPILFVLTVIDLFCAYRATTSLTYLILPLYLVSAGGVLFLDGHSIYQYYQVESLRADNTNSTIQFSDVNLKLVVAGTSMVTEDFKLQLGELDIHGDDNYVPIEFAGAIAAVVFTWLYLLVTPFFSPKTEYYDYE